MTNITKSRRQVRLSRALGIALTPKAVKYLEKRPYPPGEHGKARKRADSDYSLRLKEKQKLRAYYALREKQMRSAYEHSRKLPGMTGEVIVEMLETRLDAIVLRSGFARSIHQARQMVVHRHILVDGKILDRPSAQIKPGQTIQVKPISQTSTLFQVAALGAHRDALYDMSGKADSESSKPKPPEYIDVSIEKLTSVLTRKPLRKEIPVQVNEQFVVEYYAR